jgi:hypothetical protein
VSVALGTWLKMRMRRIVICGLLGSKYFSTFSNKRHNFRKKVIEHKVCDLIFSTVSLWNVYHSKKWARFDEKCILVSMGTARYSCRILRKLQFSRQIFEKCSNIKFHENPSCETPVFYADRRTDMTKITVTFRNFVNAPKKSA